MNVLRERRANRVVVRCDGKLDGACSAELAPTVTALLDETDHLPVVLDLAGVTAVDEAGLDTLRQLYAHAQHAHERLAPDGPRPLRLTNVPQAVQEALSAGGLAAELGLMYGSPAHAAGRDAHGYRALLPRLRELFPAPVSDQARDTAFIQRVAQALDRLDDLKSQRPYLGERRALDYAAARRRTLPEELSSLDAVIPAMVDYLQGLLIWGHPRTQENVIPPTSTAAVIGQMFGAIYNPNVIWDAYSYGVAEAEVEAAAICASLVGYDPERAAGVFTFGGTGTTLYGVKLGLEKAQPGALRVGVQGPHKVVGSQASHYAKLSVASWLGLGLDNVVTVPTDADNAMHREGLETALRRVLDADGRIACIVATMGTTDIFAIDDLEAVVTLRDELVAEYRLPYRPHVHADAVIGWAFAVFDDYDFRVNPMGFPPRTIRSLWDVRTNLQHLQLADSIGIDFHKTGYGPYISSLFLCKDRTDLELLNRDQSQMPYLFQFGAYHPGTFTLETSRSGGAILAALANLKLFGKEGYRALLGHIVTMAEALRARLERAPHAVVLNDFNHGMVTLFRVYPDGVDAAAAYHQEIADPSKAEQLAAHNRYNRQVFEALNRQMERGEGVALSITDLYRHTSYGAPIPALKSFVMSPYVDEGAMDHLLECLERARSEAAPDAT